MVSKKKKKKKFTLKKKTKLIFFFIFLRPNAKLYGTDPYTKHDQPNLPWNGFFTTKGLVDSKNILIKEDDNNDNYDFNIQNEFEFYCLSGHVFKEVLFYHKPSKSLLGITDMMIYVQDFELMKRMFYLKQTLYVLT